MQVLSNVSIRATYKMIKLSTLQRTLLYALLALPLYACSTVELRDAQSHFSAAASAENRGAFADLTGYQLGVTDSGIQATVTEYRLAQATATELVDDPRKAAELAKDGLLGTAYMIKIYSQWRLLALDGEQAEGADEDALQTLIDQAAGGSIDGRPIRLGVRDRVMLDALPGFLEHSRGQRAQDWDEANRRFQSAYCGIGRAADRAPADHDVQDYLYLAQLQTLGAWTEAIKRFFSTNAERDDQRAAIKGNAGHPICGLKPTVESERGGLTTKTLNAQLKTLGTSYRSFSTLCPIALPEICSIH
jgi:hypothetical protein